MSYLLGVSASLLADNRSKTRVLAIKNEKLVTVYLQAETSINIATSYLEIYGIDRSGLAGNVSVAGTSVGQEDMAKLLPTLANNHNPKLSKV